jgi:integrase
MSLERGVATGCHLPHDEYVERIPVKSNGGRRVPGLYVRMTKSGETVYEFRGRLEAGGSVVSRTLDATTKTDAIREARALQVRGDEGRPTTTVTFDVLAEDFLADVESKVGHRDPKLRYSKRTHDLYAYLLRSHVLPRLGRRPSGQISVRDLKELIAAMGKLSGSTVGSTLNVVSACFAFGIDNGFCERNPTRDLNRRDRPSTKRESEPRYLTAEELETLLAHVTSDTFRAVASALAFAGLRVSEALALTWGDVDFKNETLRVSAQLSPEGERVPVKSSASAGTVPLLPALAAELKAQKVRQQRHGFDRIQAHSLVFTTGTGNPQSRHNVARAIRAAAKSAKLTGDGRQPISPHDLRHTFVALALRAGVTLPEAAALARHASPAVTVAVYAGLQDDGLQVAAAKLARAGFGQA